MTSLLRLDDITALKCRAERGGDVKRVCVCVCMCVCLYACVLVGSVQE